MKGSRTGPGISSNDLIFAEETLFAALAGATVLNILENLG